MFTHPDLLIDLARQHTAELIDEANKQRLASRIRRGKHRRPPDNRQAGARAESRTVARIEGGRPANQSIKNENPVGPAGRLEPWDKPEELVAGQAR
jgi:hypothetical protein